MERKYLLIILVIIILIAFFFPKPCYKGGSALQSVLFRSCNCLGFESRFFQNMPIVPAGMGFSHCFGIPLSYECYRFRADDLESLKKYPVKCE